MAACLLFGALASTPVYADDLLPKGSTEEPRREGLDLTFDPLAEDNFITDDMEAGTTQIGAGVTCTPESVQSAPNPVPTSPSFVLLYVHPYDTPPASHMDVPRSCSNGSVLYSSVAKSSRNLASFQAAKGAGLNVRTATITYLHNHTTNQYATRGVRRFKSPTSAAAWANLKTWDEASGSSPKLTRMQNELTAKGFNVASTRYSAVLDAGDRARCGASSCSVYAGVADIPGPYGLSVRYWINPTDNSKHYYRFGCATGGDVTFGHETTHQTGGDHVSDHQYDLMAANGGGGLTYRNGVLWDYNRNSYHSTVYNSVYVGKSAIAGNYFTCT